MHLPGASARATTPLPAAVSNTVRGSNVICHTVSPADSRHQCVLLKQIVSILFELPNECRVQRPVRPIVEASADTSIDRKALRQFTVVAGQYSRRTVAFK